MSKIKILMLFVFLVAVMAGSLLGQNREPFASEIKKCSVEKNNTCWTDLIKKVREEDGLKSALGVVSKAYESDPAFSAACHDIGHYLGKETYLSFKKGEDFEITKEAAFCSYGFYHGFMESMIASGADTKSVSDFCKLVDSKISLESPDATLQCFHGIGHGWVNIHDEKNLWGNETETAVRGLKLCEQVAGNDSELERCATGVFNGISFFYINGEYGMKPRENDPLWLCSVQPEKYKNPCYLSMNSFLMGFSGGDFLRAAGYLEKIKSENSREQAMLNLAITLGIKHMESHDPFGGALLCRRVRPDLVNSCIQGYAFAFLEHGEPGKEYVRSLAFCKNGELNSSEKEACLSYIYGYLPQWYPEHKALSICREEGDSRSFCEERVEEFKKSQQ